MATGVLNLTFETCLHHSLSFTPLQSAVSSVYLKKQYVGFTPPWVNHRNVPKGRTRYCQKSSKAHKACHGFSPCSIVSFWRMNMKGRRLLNTTWRAWLRAFPWRKKPSLSKPMACWRVWGPRDGLGWCWHTLGVADVEALNRCLYFAIGWTSENFPNQRVNPRVPTGLAMN